jgi:hypothetical protein
MAFPPQQDGLACPAGNAIFASAMWISRFIATAALVLSLAFSPLALGDPLELRGEAQRGETLVHPFDHDGRHYQFRLLPVADGWSVWIGDPTNRDRNYVTPGTPPYRGINPAVIQGWHFRNADNTGPNKPGAGHVNAPGKIRKFAFVLDGTGYQRAREALEILMWPEGREETEIKAAEKRLTGVPKARITMEIEALELGNLNKDDRAWIERMAFRLRIELP